MDKGLVIWIILLSLIIVFCISLLQFSHAMYYPMTKAFEKKPIVCLEKPPDWMFESKHQMIKAVKEWQQKLGDNYPIQVILPQTQAQTNKCNIHVIYVTGIIIDGAPAPKVSGTATCGKNYCIVRININASEYPANTLKHEIGHTIGIGHLMPERMEELPGILMTNDVMIWQAGPFRWITQNDINALKEMYGDDGWTPPNKEFFNHTISTKK